MIKTEPNDGNLVFRMIYKRFLLIIAAILTISIVLGVVLFFRSQGYYSDIIYSKQVERLGFVNRSIENEIEIIKRVQYNVMMDESIESIRYFYASSTYFERYEMMEAMMGQMEALKNSSRLVADAKIYFKSVNKVIGSGEINDLAPAVWNDIERDLFTDSSPVQKYHDRLIIVEALTESPGNGLPDCVIIVDLDKKAIEEQLKYAQLTDQDIIALVDRHHNIIVSSTADGYSLLNDTPELQKQMKLNGQKYDVIQSESSFLETRLFWLYVDNTNQVVVGISLTILLIFIVIIGLIILSGFLDSYRRVYNPLKILLEDAFQQVRAGNFKYRITKYEKSHLAPLYSSFNEMVSRIDVLIEKDLKQQLLISHAQLKHLQAQINPHFMYNSYYLLYRMIKMKDYENSVILCEHLGKFYEYITRDGEDEKMLREEVEHARVYAAIQSYRFRHRISIEFGDLPESWAYEPIPRLIIQPLLENAFQYVFEKVSSSGDNILRISFHEADKGLLISVENSGNEDEHTIQEISNLILRGNRDGQVTALSNIHKRLQIFFGPEAGLAIVKSDLGGLRVEIHIPGQRTVHAE